ncbi:MULTISPECIES: hypothetical protein [Bradyrhizobium]|uniref:hypothetical protein n=1 Tax=Bradyrhizobium TaxID=374 RepID=UPI001BAE21E8|nr:hypothetical protein [Bradyrhizobium liaoningense]MBR0988357.1 hypothetical protein [Bradyrhizobium liaoningense]GMO22170.1 hypothetical protein TM233_30260 [Bradyrhizobium sp. TM233]GMP12221.1 hypothetical protein TM239_64840 [Bradyrhizobium sp. TM239]
MAQLSVMARRVIETFAGNAGIVARPAPDFSYGFEFAERGTLSILAAEDGLRIIVCLSRLPRRTGSSVLKDLLVVAGYDPFSGAMVHAGLAVDGALALAIDMDEPRFDLQSLDEALSRLDELHRSIS